MDKNELASQKTTKKIVEIARKYFSEIGYEKTSLKKIVQEAGMTRGAVYHHFKNKKALFIAVLNQVQEEIGENVEREAMASDEEWEQLVLGCVGFVEAATLDSNRRIVLIDALNVVDWEEWRKMDKENSVSLLSEQLQTVKDAGELVELDVEIIANLISGALNELSLHLANSKVLSREELLQSIDYLLKGFRRHGN